MNIRTLAIAAAAVLLPLAAVGCGSDSSDTLDKGELAKQFEKAGVPEAQAECAADALAGMFTQDEIDDLNAGKTDLPEKKSKAFAAAVTKCVTADAGG